MFQLQLRNYQFIFSSNIKVGLGSVDYRNPEQLISSILFTAHPSHNSATFDYDFAVITLISAASLGGDVGIILLVISS